MYARNFGIIIIPVEIVMMPHFAILFLFYKIFELQNK